MLTFALNARNRVLLLISLSLCFTCSVLCDDQVFVDIHISVDEPILSQTLAVNSWAFNTISGVSLSKRSFFQKTDILQAKLLISKVLTIHTSLCISQHFLRPTFLH
jgi:hypothetical protein